MFRVPLIVLFCYAAVVASPLVAAEDKTEKKVQKVEGELKSYKDGKLVILVGKEEKTYKVAADFEIDSGLDGRTFRVTAEKFFATRKEGHKLVVKTEDDKVTGISDLQIPKK
jgi:hypothetical protein